MTRIVICDDDSDDLEELSQIIEKYYDNAHQNALSTSYSVLKFMDPQKVLEYVEDGNQIDIAILDVIMPKMNGMELASGMRELGFGGTLVFLTSSNDFAMQSYAVKAFSYILKPAHKEAVCDLLTTIEKTRQTNDRYGFPLIRRSAVRFVLYTELMYIEAMNHQLLFHLTDGEIINIYATLKEYSEMLLSQPQMCKPQKSFIINLDYVRSFENSAIIMRDRTRISLPKDYEAIKEKWLERMFGRRNR
ncbi:MAG: LytTR family DNA-binding domain-containing protein [Lachnospiraceae bacterium]|jgi:DNA-binding LytR/AlgR family response regulator|nr:LytTR family DNA-binding domain-containing protein [Lachnospiraceae bacterium]